MKTFLTATLLTLTLAAPALAQREPAPPTERADAQPKTKEAAAPEQAAPAKPQDWSEVARCRVILLVDYVKRDGKSFSGMAGSTY